MFKVKPLINLVISTMSTIVNADAKVKVKFFKGGYESFWIIKDKNVPIFRRNTVVIYNISFKLCTLGSFSSVINILTKTW